MATGPMPFVSAEQYLDREEAEVYRKVESNRWLLSVFAGPEAVVELQSIDCHFTLGEIYNRIKLEV